jgi:hypothetical protein
MKERNFLGVNEIYTLQYTYSDVIDENVMYVEVNGQSNLKKKPQDMVLMFSKEQIVEMYESMLSMEISNSEFLKK